MVLIPKSTAVISLSEIIPNGRAFAFSSYGHSAHTHICSLQFDAIPEIQLMR